MKKVMISLVSFALTLCLALPATADVKDFGSFTALITINLWDTDNVSESSWDWLQNSTSGNIVVDKLMDDYDGGGNYYFFQVEVESNNDDKPITGGSIQQSGSTAYTFVSDENDNIMYVSKMRSSISGLYKYFSAGTYTINVTFQNGTTESGIIELPDYTAMALKAPSVKYSEDDGTPEDVTVKWKDTSVTKCGVELFTAQNNKTKYLVDTKQDVSSADDEYKIDVSNISYSSSLKYFVQGANFITKDNIENYDGYQMAASSFRVWSSSGGDDGGDKKSGCTLNPQAGFSLEWLLLMAGPILVAVRRFFK